MDVQQQSTKPHSSVVAGLTALLAQHEHERVIVVGTTCVGKSTLLKQIPEGRDQDAEVFACMSKEEAQYVCQTPWTEEIGATMNRHVRNYVKSKAGSPVFGTVVIDCDFIIELSISDELLKQRVAARKVNFADAKNMQSALHQNVLSSGIPYTEFNL